MNYYSLEVTCMVQKYKYIHIGKYSLGKIIKYLTTEGRAFLAL